MDRAEDFVVVISELLSQRYLVDLEVRVQLQATMTTHVLLLTNGGDKNKAKLTQ